MNTTPRASLLQAMQSAGITCHETKRDTPAVFVNRPVHLGESPTLALIDDSSGVGPSVWAVAPELFRWARIAFVQSLDGRPDSYEAAVKAAQKFRRVLLIQTDAAHADAWRSAAADGGY